MYELCVLSNFLKEMSVFLLQKAICNLCLNCVLSLKIVYYKNLSVGGVWALCCLLETSVCYKKWFELCVLSMTIVRLLEKSHL